MDSQPEVVYHYTSAETLLKIVKSQSIWATNLLYLNDFSESEHCIKALRSRLPEFLSQNPSEFGEELESALDSISKELNPPYVASFCAERDSLSQWRSYCPNGNGVSIGFRVSALREGVLTWTPVTDYPLQKSTLHQVRYLTTQGWEFQDSIFRECIASLKEHEEEQDALPEEEQSHWSRSSILQFEILSRSCLYKHPGFAGETEYRLIAPTTFLTGVPIQCRCSRTTVIPYVEIYMPKIIEDATEYRDCFIAEVKVGPTPLADLTVDALKTMFQSRALNVSVSASDIPYRDL